ncbi:MAG: hypothetical protein IPM98_05855 [Lewinellaceae bacterium]|nr:hypothetical protein [Lewinellaceae bacterium]
MDFKTTASKNVISIGILLSLVFISIAAYYYPGGSLNDIHSPGYSFKHNYISHLLDYNALNGLENKGRPWGVAGVVIMGITTGLAFIRFAIKIAIKHHSNVIKISGFLLILVNVLITMPRFHNAMVTIGSFLTLLVFFYITVLLWKTNLTVLKIFSGMSLLSFYGAAYMFGTRTALDYMPFVQKFVHVLQIILIISVEYFTTNKDFEHIKK